MLRLILIALLLSTAVAATANACPAGTSKVCNNYGNCWCVP